MAEILFRNKKIFYRAEGKGKPVMLLHGFGEDGTIWKYQFAKLKQEYFVIVPDLPGSGQSQMLEGECSLGDYAELVGAIAEKEMEQKTNSDDKTFSLIGHSMGGYITLEFAKNHPEKLNSFGLFHSSAFADSDDKIAARRKSIDFIQKNGAKPFLKTSVPDLFSEKTRVENPSLVNDLLTIANQLSGEALIQYYEAMIKRTDTTDVLSSFPKPILFMIGKHDMAVPLQDSLKQCHLPRVAVIHILQHSGHVGMWEEMDLSTTYVTNFLHDFV